MLEKESLSADGARAVEGVAVMMPKYKVHKPPFIPWEDTL